MERPASASAWRTARDQRSHRGHRSGVPGSADPPRGGRQPEAGHLLGIGRRRIRADVDPSEPGLAVDVDVDAAAVVVVRAAAAVLEGAGRAGEEVPGGARAASART